MSKIPPASPDSPKPAVDSKKDDQEKGDIPSGSKVIPQTGSGPNVQTKKLSERFGGITQSKTTQSIKPVDNSEVKTGPDHTEGSEG